MKQMNANGRIPQSIANSYNQSSDAIQTQQSVDQHHLHNTAPTAP